MDCGDWKMAVLGIYSLLRSSESDLMGTMLYISIVVCGFAIAAKAISDGILFVYAVNAI